MSPWTTVILVILVVQIADSLITTAFCIISKHYYAKVKPETDNGAVGGVHPQRFSIRALKTVYSFYSGWVRYKLRKLGVIPCHWYRRLKLKYIYQVKLGKKAVVYGGVEIRSPWNIEIGEGSIIGDEAKLDGRNGIYIRDNVNLSTGVWIWTEQHDINDPYFATNDEGGAVIIEEHAWISARTTLLPGVRVKKGAVIAAGAVVTKDCDEYSVYGGTPAKKIGTRNSDLKYSFDGTHLPFY